MADALDDFVQAQIDALSCGNWLFNCECGRCADRREMQLEHDSRQIALRDAARYRFIRNQMGSPKPEEFDAAVDGDMRMAERPMGKL